MRRSMQLHNSLKNRDEPQIERTTVRNLAAARRGDNKWRNSDYDSIAGKPTANFGKPFSYMESCVPGARKMDSNRVVEGS